MSRSLLAVILLSIIRFSHTGFIQKKIVMRLISFTPRIADLGNRKNNSGIRLAEKFQGADACAKINAALRNLPDGMGIVDARGFSGTVQRCNSNMFVGYKGSGGMLLLPPMLLNTTAQQVQPSQLAVEGASAGNPRGTIIRAAPELEGKAVWVMSNGGRFNHGSQLRGITIDCNGVASTTGFFSTDINEKSGLSNVSIVNCPKYGINIDASKNHLGPAQSYYLRNIEVYSNEYGSASTIAVRLVGNGGGGPAEVANVTASGTRLHPIRAGFLFANLQGAFAHSLHSEYVQHTVDLGDPVYGGVVNVTLLDVSGGPGDTESLVDVTNEHTNSICLLGLAKGDATYILTDEVRHKILKDQYLAQYCVGGSPTQPYLSTSAVLPSRPPQFTYSTLPKEADSGAIVYCSDCSAAAEGAKCSNGGTGKEAILIAGDWKCF